MSFSVWICKTYLHCKGDFSMTFMFPCMSAYVNLIWSTPAKFLSASLSSFLLQSHQWWLELASSVFLYIFCKPILWNHLKSILFCFSFSSVCAIECGLLAMYKTSNTGTGNGMRGMRKMLCSGECCETFQEMSTKITVSDLSLKQYLELISTYYE